MRGSERTSTPTPLRGRKSLGSVRPQKPRGTFRWKVWLKRAAIALGILAVAGFLGIVGMFWWYGRDLPEVTSLRNYRPPQVTRVVDRNGQTIGELYSERRTVIPMDRIPRVLVLCVLAAEDADFYQHEGLDYPGILRALARDILSGRRAQGASTITQQVVKLMLLSPERTLSRKTRELILARRLEQELEKNDILHLYLNHINFGHGRYGVQEAARFYFDKDANDLTLAEASLIAGIPQSPARLSPRTHPLAARRRQLFVLQQLEDKRERWPDLTAAEIQRARETVVRLSPPPESSEQAPEVVEMARRVLREQVGAEAAARGGYTIHTTLDARIQKAGRDAVRAGLEALDQRQQLRGPLRPPRRRRDVRAADAITAGRTYDAVVTGTDDEGGTIELEVAGGHRGVADIEQVTRWNPEKLPPSRFAERGAHVRVSIERLAEEEEDQARAEVALELGPQGALIAIDPRTRDVLAMIGSYEAVSGFNRATAAVRQPGSTFKPIVYALGLKSRRFTPASLVIDAPATYDQWRPRNYETWNYRGIVSLRTALAQSINSAAVRVIEEVTPEQTVQFAQQLGITTELEASLPLALGASDVRPIELVNAYATFAAGGRWEEPRVIARIVGPDGREVPLPARADSRDVVTPAEAYVITNMLEEVVETGTATAARRLNRPAAGKTGTSDDVVDAWFVGYTPDLVAGVWVGYDDRRSLGRRESGARSALPIWIDFVRAAMGRRPAVEFPVPSGVVTVRIDPATGLLALDGQENAIDEVFLDGTQPTETTRPPDVADPNQFLMEQIGGP